MPRSDSSPTPISDPASDSSARKGLGCMIAFCGLFFLVGAVLFFTLFVRPVWKIAGARSWPAIPCRIISSTLTPHSDSDGTTYSADIVYSYSIGSTVYQSQKYSFSSQNTGGYNGKQAIIAAFPPGSTATCYVNPSNPSEAVLHRGFTREVLFGVFPLIFCAFGAGVPFAIVRSSKTSATPKARWQPRKAALSADLTTGPVVLRPKGSRIGGLIGILLIALFWNGIVSVFIWQSLNGGIGFFAIFLAIFLIPFVVIGLLMIAAVINSFLVLFNAKSQIRLSRGALRPGEAVEIAWQMGGGLFKPQKLEIFVEGQEEATYVRGTDTVTDKALFFRSELLQTTAPASMGAGTLRLELPRDTMHSFQSPHNKIVWILNIHAHVVRWPDVKEEFVLAVEPRVEN